MTVMTETAGIVVGSRVELASISGVTRNPGTVLVLNGEHAQIVWDDSMTPSLTREGVESYSANYPASDLRLLTQAEQTLKPVPVVVAQLLADRQATAPIAEVVAKAEYDRVMTELSDCQQRLVIAHRELTVFRSEVLEAAVEGVRQHGWCDEVREIVEGLGLEWHSPSQRVSFRVQIEATVYATCRNADNVSEEFVNDSLSLDGVDLSMDGDWEDVDVSDVTIEGVEDVEEE